MPVLQVHYQDGVAPLPNSLDSRFCRLGQCIGERHDLEGEVLLILTDDQHMRFLNANFRAKDRTTDVLSFDLGAPEGVPNAAPSKEIYISLEQAERQAQDLGVALDEELARLLVHSLLHLAGFDHDTPEKLEFMERETDDILQIPDTES
jgi:probable rRNA maturation factor